MSVLVCGSGLLSIVAVILGVSESLVFLRLGFDLFVPKFFSAFLRRFLFLIHWFADGILPAILSSFFWEELFGLRLF